MRILSEGMEVEVIYGSNSTIPGIRGTSFITGRGAESSSVYPDPNLKEGYKRLQSFFENIDEISWSLILLCYKFSCTSQQHGQR